jgi:hypothetical protein
MEVATVPPGRFACTIADARIVQNNDGDTVWLFLTLEPVSEAGEVLGQVDDPFITIAAAPGTPNFNRVVEGLRRLAMYGAATGLEFDGKEPHELPEMLIGRKVMAMVSRQGTGIHAKNRVGAIGRVA